MKDVGNAEFWTGGLSKLLYDNWIDPKRSVSHYRSKASDRDVTGAIIPLSDTEDVMRRYGLSVWQSHNSDPAMDEISATPFRTMDVNAAENQHEIDNTLAAPQYIRRIANEARENNPDKKLLAGLPVTMLDLTLQRLRLERNLSTTEILGGTQAASLDALKQAIIQVLQKPGQEITGSRISAQPSTTAQDVSPAI